MFLKTTQKHSTGAGASQAALLVSLPAYTSRNTTWTQGMTAEMLCRQQLVRRIGTVGSVVAVQWHSRLNQIFIGTGAHKHTAFSHVITFTL